MWHKNLIIIFLLLWLSSVKDSYCALKQYSISIEEDLELERHLKFLNKPAIKTFQTDYGDIIDCVDIRKQPALDHPLLKNHKIQRKPSHPLPRVNFETSGRAKFSSFISSKHHCPPETVPIPRTTKEDLMRAKFLSKSKESNGTKPEFHFANVKFTPEPGQLYHGALAYIDVYNLSVAEDQKSAAAIRIINDSDDDNINVIQAGWMIYPKLNGDSMIRIYAYWIGNGHKKSGCYNYLCPGFVQVDKTVFLGQPLTDVSFYGGEQSDFPFIVYQDVETNNWLLVVSENSTVIGYWPNELFLRLSEGATTVELGGSTMTHSGRPSPPMGSGHLPDGSFLHTAYIKKIRFFNKTLGVEFPRDGGAIAIVDQPKCYDVQYFGYDGDVMEYALLFGGPGGQCHY